MCLNSQGGKGRGGYFLVQFLPVSAAGLSLQSILWVIIDPILVTFGDMEHLLKPEPSHFKYLLTRGRIFFPLKS